MTVYLVSGLNRLGEKFTSEFRTSWGAKAAVEIYKGLGFPLVEMSEVVR